MYDVKTWVANSGCWLVHFCHVSHAHQNQRLYGFVTSAYSSRNLFLSYQIRLNFSACQLSPWFHALHLIHYIIYLAPLLKSKLRKTVLTSCSPLREEESNHRSRIYWVILVNISINIEGVNTRFSAPLYHFVGTWIFAAVRCVAYHKLIKLRTLLKILWRAL